MKNISRVVRRLNRIMNTAKRHGYSGVYPLTTIRDNSVLIIVLRKFYTLQISVFYQDGQVRYRCHYTWPNRDARLLYDGPDAAVFRTLTTALLKAQ